MRDVESLEDMSSLNDSDRPDLDSSSEDYSRRFSGEVGTWFLERQSTALLSVLNYNYQDLSKSLSVLNIGGGHGQLTIPFNQLGLREVIIGSALQPRQMFEENRRAGHCDFIVSNLQRLPFPDRAFDIVVSFRILPHINNWEQLIDEMCRVAKRSVIIDFPIRCSVNAIGPALFSLKKKVEENTRKFRLFNKGEITKRFLENDFNSMVDRKQFFLPMAAHRAVRCRVLSQALESVGDFLRITPILGSPVISRFDRLR